MSGINQSVVLDVCRMEATFADPIGNTRRISGTGFWLSDENRAYFVTNKHNVDPRLKLGAETEFELWKLRVELRQFNGDAPLSVTRYFAVDLCGADLRVSDSADVAVLVSPRYLEEPTGFRIGKVLKIEDLADQAFHTNSVGLMDLASFIGFPGQGASRWWDRDWNLGVARVVNVASVPGIPFANDDVSTADVTLVAGLSFSGSSGSVVILHEKGIKPGAGLRFDGHVPPKVLGLMSGHWWEQEEPQMFRHSGFSYYTRSTSILGLLQ